MADYISKIQTPDGTDYNLKASALPYGATSGDGSAYTVTVSPDVALVDGTAIVVKFNVANTVLNPTINVNNLGAKLAYGLFGHSAIGSILNGSVYILVYDYSSDYWRILLNDRVLISKSGSSNTNLPVLIPHTSPNNGTLLNTMRYTPDLRVNPSIHAIMESGSTATGSYSHAEGNGTKAQGAQSHAEGATTVANGGNSHAEGRFTQTLQNAEHAQGSYNLSHTDNTTDGFGTNGSRTIHSIGIGTDDNARKNAVEVMQNGDIYVSGVGSYDGIHIKNETGAPADTATLQETIDNLTTNVISHGTSDTGTLSVPFEISPNNLHAWGSVTALYLEAGASVNGIVNEYMIRFTADTNFVELSLWSGVRWSAAPIFVDGNTYEISIVDDLAIYAEYEPAQAAS